MTVRCCAEEWGEGRVKQVSEDVGCEAGDSKVVPSLLMCAVVSELSAECRGYRCGAAICARRRNAE
eukprot:3548553-Rhodomonas_salina.1